MTPRYPLVRHRRQRALGFTLIELLVTLGIILVLLGILIPTVSRIRKQAQTAAVRAQIASLDAAIARYQSDFQAFPGPLPRGEMYPSTTPPIYDMGGAQLGNISGAENLVLGLMGGLAPRPAGGWTFNPQLLGSGPRNLNPSNPKKYTAYVDGMILSEGDYKDGAGDAIDSVIPEFMDKFSNAMPILYLRAQIGAKGVVSIDGKDSGGTLVIGQDTNNNPIPTQYDLNQILGYTIGTNGAIGEGKSISFGDYKNVAGASSTNLMHGVHTVKEQASFDKGNSNYTYPYDAFPYFNNPQMPPTDPTLPNKTGTARNQNRCILISAGADRVYGTADDITNAGEVLP